MTNSYYVAFYRRVLNSQGRCFLTRLDEVRIDGAPSGQDAMSDAARIFESRYGVADWRALADRYRITSASNGHGIRAAEQFPLPEFDRDSTAA